MKRAILLLFILASFGPASAQIPSYVPTNGLVGWWPFNGNANDGSGNGKNGSVNGAGLTNDRFGNTNGAPGVYFLELFDPTTSNMIVRKILIQ